MKGTEIQSKVTWRPYETGDKGKILDLFRLTYGQELKEGYWNWRFRDNPAGPGVIDLCCDGDVLAAHYAATTISLWILGHGHLSGLSGTTMTHSAYRGRGLFPILARNTYRRMKEMGMAMVWGFPNSMSHRGFIKDLNWVDLYEVPTFRLSLSNSLSLPSSGEAVVELEEFPQNVDDLWKSVRNDYSILTVRDWQFLNWRYVQNPTGRYRIVAHLDGSDLLGYAVYKRYKNEFQVVDILTVNDTDIGVQLITHIIHRAIDESLDAVSMWLNVTHPLHRALERLGFSNGLPVTYFGGLVLQPELSNAGLYDFKRWYITMGDSDVF